MEILDKKSNRMSRVIVGVSEANVLAILESLNELVYLEFLTDPKLQRILDFLLLRNLLSNELFFTFYYFATAYFINSFRFLTTLVG